MASGAPPCSLLTHPGSTDWSGSSPVTLTHDTSFHGMSSCMINVRRKFAAGLRKLCLQKRDLDATVKRRDEARTDILAKASPQLLHEGFQTFFPNPVRSHYTAITFSPRLPLLQRVINLASDQRKRNLILLASGAVAIVACGALALRRVQSRI